MVPLVNIRLTDGGSWIGGASRRRSYGGVLPRTAPDGPGAAWRSIHLRVARVGAERGAAAKTFAVPWRVASRPTSWAMRLRLLEWFAAP